MAPVNQIVDSIPYPTHEFLNGRRVWAVRYNLGALPNNTTKSLQLPTQITSIWGPPEERWIDVGSSYVYTTTGNIYPLPYSSFFQRGGIFGNGSTDNVIIELENTIIRLRTESNRSNQIGIIVIKFTRE